MVSRSTKLLLNCRVGDSTMGPLFSVVASGTLPPGIPSVSSRGQACEDIASSNDSRGANLVAGGVRVRTALGGLSGGAGRIGIGGVSSLSAQIQGGRRGGEDPRRHAGQFGPRGAPRGRCQGQPDLAPRPGKSTTDRARAHRLDRSTSRPGSTVGESGGDAADLRRGEGPTGRDGQPASTGLRRAGRGSRGGRGPVEPPVRSGPTRSP